MSVAIFRKPELEDIAGSLDRHLIASGYRKHSYTKQDAYRVIGVASIANQTAAFLTYGPGSDWSELEGCDLDDSKPGKLDAKETYRRIGSLFYNCVSNDGTECMPPHYQAILEDMTRSIVVHAAGWRRS